MVGHKNKLSRFWQELKRRRVIHVITVYASAAFVIIELLGNLTEPLNLPDGLTTIVFIVLAIGFPLAIILSWLYDLTAGTFERTKPFEDLPEKEKVQVPNAWKIATYISFIVIAGLIALNITSRRDLIKPGMIQAVAVLPFNNYTGDENLDYVADGMHASLISDIGKVSALRVTGETTSKTYKDTDKSAPQIGKELNVDILIEPTLTCWGENVCVLIRAVTTTQEEKQILVREYNVEREEILSFYGRVIKEISQELKVELSPEETGLLSKSRTIDTKAYDEYLKAHSYLGDGSKESLFKAVDNLNSAIAKEPAWAPLYSAMAMVWMAIQQMGFEEPSIAAPEIFRNLDKAFVLDPELPDAHFLSAMIAHLVEWDWEKSEKEFLQALAVNPNDARSRMLYAQLLCVLHRTDEARTHAQLAYDLDPLDPYMKIWHGALLTGVGDCKTALALAEEITATDPEHYLANNIIEEAAFQCKEYDKVIKAIRYSLHFSLEENVLKEIERIYSEHGIVSAYEEIMKHMEKYAKNNPVSFIDMSMRYVSANQLDKAMDWIEKGFEMHDPQMTYITTRMYNLDPLFNNPRFIEIVNKMNLALPSVN